MAKELKLARETIERCAALDWDLVIGITRNLLKIENWTKLANSKEAKLSQLFSIRASHSGDGKSKETAIHFKKARTHNEAIQAFYKYLEQEGIALHRRRLAGIEDGYLFDIALTDRGPLWVKYRMSE